VLIGLYVMAPLAVLLVLWLRDELLFYRRTFTPTTHVMLQCDVCLHHFLCDRDVALPRCPQCGNLNRRR
jgi:hypothetical protein